MNVVLTERGPKMKKSQMHGVSNEQVSKERSLK